MNFAYSPRVEALRQQLQAFMDDHIVPRIGAWHAEVAAGQYPVSFMEDLKALAREEGLWNLFLPSLGEDEPGTGLSNLEYAPLAEIMGRVHWASEVFNCNAPDTGNMELLHLFATPEQRQRWLEPLLNGEIRSAFAMTEPDVPSSDATNIQTLIRRDGDDYVINGRKWFITNASHPNCRLLIVMGKTDPDAETHQQQSMILVPFDTPGVELLRNIPVMNHIAPEGHSELLLRNVRVPASNLLGKEGDGFMMAQARLGPGRIHHCMRSIGMAALPGAQGVRQVPAAVFQCRRLDRRVAHRDRAGAAAGTQDRLDDRRGRRQGRAQGNLDDQGAGAAHAHQRGRPRDPGLRRDGPDAGHAAGRYVDRRPRAALRRWPGSGASAQHRENGNQGQ